jgi:SAM-dependent MidA family methyltransferase
MDPALPSLWGSPRRPVPAPGRPELVTASDAGDAFGAAVAHPRVDLDARLAHPDPFHLVELGCGRGLLTRDVLVALGKRAPGLRARVRCILADTSPGMRAAAAAQVPEASVVTPEELPSGVTGCLLAVELLDALPVHRLRRRGGTILEIGVGLDEEGRLVEVEMSPGAPVSSLVARYGAAPEEGDEAEVCVALDGIVAMLAKVLARGFILIVDYGHDAATLYGPTNGAGTLLAYHRHRVHERVLDHPGEQDSPRTSTSPTWRTPRPRSGLRPLGRTTQDRFLIANGILERFSEQEDEAWASPAGVERRRAALQLLHPDGMGRRFHVLVLGRGEIGEEPLRGLADPFARSAPSA